MKPKDFVHQIGKYLSIGIETYQHIILQNIAKAKGYSFVSKAAELAKKSTTRMTSLEYIAILKGMMSPEEWKIIRSLHKRSN